jgi:hypothetical protein
MRQQSDQALTPLVGLAQHQGRECCNNPHQHAGPDGPMRVKERQGRANQPKWHHPHGQHLRDA